MANDDLHAVTVRITDLTYRIFQAREKVDGIQVATRFAMWAEEWAEKELHASNLIQRAIEREQLPATTSIKGQN